MKFKVRRLGVATLLILSFFLSKATAQESINAAGGNASGSGGSISYSVGQVVYTTNVESAGSVFQGVQQAFEISVVSGIEDDEGISLTISAYPNPTSDYLTLSINDNVNTSYDRSSLSYQLYDLRGKLIRNKIITSQQTSIIMSNLVPASYFVKILKGREGVSQEEVKTFKIIKIQ